MSCTFCEVIAGMRPGWIVAATPSCLAIMDVHPVRRGHVLVIPRVHSPFLAPLPEPTQAEMFALGRRIAAAQVAAGLGESSTYLLLDGPGSSQHVPHAHLHVVPRRHGDLVAVVLVFVGRMLLSFFGRDARADDLERTAVRLREHLPVPGQRGPALTPSWAAR